MNASPGPASLPGHLNRLEQADLIRLAAALPDLEYIFRHALIQESVYQTLLRADRRRVHQAAGEALEALLGGRVPPAELAPILARHFEEAADHRRALRYYTLAGDAALAGYANAEAIAAFTSALAAAERAAATGILPAAVWQHLYEARGRAFELSSRYPEALANYQAMAQRAAALGDRRLALAATVACGQLFATANALLDLPRAEQMAFEALAEARVLGDEPAEAKILWNQLNLFRFNRRYLEARAAGERSLEIARRLGLEAQAASTVNDLIHVYAALGLWPEFEQASAEARRRWQALGNTAMLADSLSTTALYLGMLGQLDAALSLAQDSLRHATAIGNQWGQSYSLMAMIWPYWYSGQPELALETARECIRVGREAWPFAAQTAGAWLAILYDELGDPAAGLPLLDEVADLADSTGGLLRMGYLSARAVLELRTHGLAAASATLQALDQVLRRPLLWELDALLRAQSATALAQADPAHALDVTQSHVALVRERGATTYLPDALVRLAQALLLHGRLAEARDALLEALALAQSMGARMTEWAVLYALGRWELDHGDPAAAQPHWAAARQIVTRLAARLPTADLRQSFLARPDVRALLEAEAH